MKRYLVFACDNYYPAGGWDDFVGTYETIIEAHKAGKEARRSWWQIVDTETLKEVEGPGA